MRNKPEVHKTLEIKVVKFAPYNLAYLPSFLFISCALEKEMTVMQASYLINMELYKIQVTSGRKYK